MMAVLRSRPEIRQAVRTAAEALKRAGFRVEAFRPEGLEEARALWKKFFVKVGGMLIKPMFHGREADISPMLRQFLEWSDSEPDLTADSVLEAWFRRDTLRSEFLAQMREYPILLCPPAAIPAFRHGERSWVIEGKSVHYLDAWSYTEWFNLLGNPAAVVPVMHSRGRIADWRADRRTSVGRRAGLDGRCLSGERMPWVEGAADCSTACQIGRLPYLKTPAVRISWGIF